MMRTSSSPPRRASPSRGSAAACPNVVMPAFASVVRSASSRSTSVNGNGASSPGSCATDVTGCVRPARARSSAAPGVGANPSRAVYPSAWAPRCSRAASCGRPLNRRRLPPISATTASGRRQARVGRERQRPRRELRERARFAVGIAIAGMHFRRERECRGNQLPGADAGFARCRVGGDDARIVPAAADDERVRGVSRRLRASEDVERQRREEEAGPEHGETASAKWPIDAWN